MAEINLLQNRLKDTTNTGTRNGKIILVVLSVILIVLVGATAIIFFLNNSLQTQIAAASTTNQDLHKKLTDQQNTLGSAQTFQAQLANLRVLIRNHTYLSPLLDELSKVTYAKSQYVSFDVTDAGKIHVEGLVSTYTDLGKLLLGLSSSTQFKNVKLLSIVPSTGNTNGYLFSIDMSVAPDIFTKK
jgi:Tfp pilus assembly protein PilN